MATYNDIVDINLLTRFFNNFGVFGVPLADWKPHTKYKLGTCIVYGDNLYRCKTAHTSADTFNDSNWTLLGGGSGGGINRWKANGNYKIDDVVLCSSEVNTVEWVSDTSYAVDDIVVYGSLVYKCITANSDTTFNIDKWELVREVYTVLYRCITANNDSTFIESKWEQIGGSGNTNIEELFA